jgi:hypothetical protein
LSATAVSSNQIDLEWTDVATETGYRIERSPDGVNEWTKVGETERDVTRFSDGQASPGTSYHYRVFAMNAGGDSQASHTTAATSQT